MLRENEYIYAFTDFIIFSLFLIFVFLSIQIWFLWKDMDKSELKLKMLINESFFKKNSIYIFSLGTFLMVNELEFLKGKNFGILDALALASIVLFTYNWYSTLKPHANRKSIPQEFKLLK